MDSSLRTAIHSPPLNYSPPLNRAPSPIHSPSGKPNPTGAPSTREGSACSPTPQTFRHLPCISEFSPKQDDPIRSDLDFLFSSIIELNIAEVQECRLKTQSLIHELLRKVQTLKADNANLQDQLRSTQASNRQLRCLVHRQGLELREVKEQNQALERKYYCEIAKSHPDPPYLTDLAGERSFPGPITAWSQAKFPPNEQSTFL